METAAAVVRPRTEATLLSLPDDLLVIVLDRLAVAFPQSADWRTRAAAAVEGAHYQLDVVPWWGEAAAATAASIAGAACAAPAAPPWGAGGAAVVGIITVYRFSADDLDVSSVFGRSPNFVRCGQSQDWKTSSQPFIYGLGPLWPMGR